MIGAASGKETIDINKVKKALKRREQAKVKSAKEWNERIKSLDRQEKEGIAKREANISARKQSKMNHLAGLPDDSKDSKGGKGNRDGVVTRQKPLATASVPVLKGRRGRSSTRRRIQRPSRQLELTTTDCVLHDPKLSLQVVVLV